MNYRALIKNLPRLFASAGLALMLAACATNAAPPDERHPDDPWEPFNRNMYKFNRSLDKGFLRPLATGYEKAMPDPVETGVTNFFDNLQSLRTIFNLTLQGRFADTGRMVHRFLVNSVFGVAGIFDVATAGGLPDFQEDFGQTMAVWGWEDSPYLVLPLLGPSTVRDGLGMPFDSFTDIVWREVTSEYPWSIGIDIVQDRANLLPREDQLEDAFDEYLFVRDAYLQNREFKITGESQTPDYDEFLDEEWEEEPPEEQPEQADSGNEDDGDGATER